MERYLVYNHPSVPPMGIVLDKGYTLEELQKRFTMEEIQGFFKPYGFTFDELNAEKAVKK